MQDDQRRIAFDLLYAENAQPVHRFALRLCGNPDDAEDLAAEALTQAYRRLDGFKGASSVRTWLFAIVLNQWHMRRRKRVIPQDQLEAARHVAGTFDFADLDLADAICRLSEPLREAFLLVKGEGLTHAEAASAVRVPIGTMYFRVHAAVKQLRRQLGTPEGVEQKTNGVTCNHEV